MTETLKAETNARRPRRSRRGRRARSSTRAARRRATSATIKRAAWSVLEGMAVTFSYLRRPPITVQYPDRTRSR